MSDQRDFSFEKITTFFLLLNMEIFFEWSWNSIEFQRKKFTFVDLKVESSSRKLNLKIIWALQNTKILSFSSCDISNEDPTSERTFPKTLWIFVEKALIILMLFKILRGLNSKYCGHFFNKETELKFISKRIFWFHIHIFEARKYSYKTWLRHIYYIMKGFL